jgi:hydroxymethylpyrimidine pyrophosphatase-like HAD family hydrolase
MSFLSNKDATRKAKTVANSLRYVSLWYYDHAIYAKNVKTEDHVRLVRLFERLTKSKVTIVEDQLEDNYHCPPSRLVVLFLDAPTDKIAATFYSELNGDATVATIVPASKGLYIEILIGHIHKGNGLRDLCHSLQIPIANCIAIGDGDNDTEFLQTAGFGICMKNGSRKSQQVPVALTQYSNNQDQVMLALQNLGALGMLKLNDDQ